MRISDWSSDVCSSDLPTTNLAIAKTSGIVSDPVNGTTNAKAIPGARMRYCILVTNNGSGTATGIAIADPLPAGTSFVPGSLRSGASCAGAATARSEEHTSELQSLMRISYAVFCLKKKNNTIKHTSPASDH